MKKRSVLCVFLSMMMVMLSSACGSREGGIPSVDFVTETNDGGGSHEETGLPGDENVPETEGDWELSGVSLETVLENYEDALTVEYENFRLPEKITIQAENIYAGIYAVLWDSFQNNAGDLLNLIFGDELKEEYMPDLEANGDIIYDDMEHGMYACISQNGFVSFMKPGYFEVSSRRFEVVDIVHVDRGDSLENSYMLTDGEESLADAVSYVENWILENWAPYEGAFTYQVKTIEVIQVEGAEHYYYITVEKLLDGVPLEDNIRMQMNNEDGMPTYIPEMIVIEMVNRDSIDSFTTVTGMPIITVMEEEQEGWISLPDCMRMLEDLFASYRVYEISDIEIKYEIAPDYDSIDPSIVNPGYGMPGTGMTFVPVWQLVIDVSNRIEGFQRKYINVNMRTGEVWFVLD